MCHHLPLTGTMFGVVELHCGIVSARVTSEQSIYTSVTFCYKVDVRQMPYSCAPSPAAGLTVTLEGGKLKRMLASCQKAIW